MACVKALTPCVTKASGSPPLLRASEIAKGSPFLAATRNRLVVKKLMVGPKRRKWEEQGLRTLIQAVFSQAFILAQGRAGSKPGGGFRAARPRSGRADARPRGRRARKSPACANARRIPSEAHRERLVVVVFVAPGPIGKIHERLHGRLVALRNGMSQQRSAESVARQSDLEALGQYGGRLNFVVQQSRSGVFEHRFV